MNDFAECPGKVALVIKPAFRRNFSNGCVAFTQSYTSLTDTIAVDVLRGSQVEAFLKIPAQGTHRKAGN